MTHLLPLLAQGEAQIALIVILAITFGMIVLWFLSLVDCLSRRFENNDKLVWVIVILFLGPLGSLIYFAIGRS